MATQVVSERKGLFTWNGEPMTLVGNPVSAGDRAPDFNVRTVDHKPFRLADALAGDTRAALLVAVPSIDTGTCSRETHTFNERVTALPGDKMGFFTVSMDLPYAQKRWCGAEGVERMTMLSDFYDHSFGLAFGIRVKERGLLARSVFIIDKTGIVRTAILVPEVSQEPDYDAVIAAAQAVAR